MPNASQHGTMQQLVYISIKLSKALAKIEQYRNAGVRIQT